LISKIMFSPRFHWTNRYAPVPTGLVCMNSFGSPAVTPPFASTTSCDTTEATDCVTTEFRKAAFGWVSVTSNV
jgi:hypothetical protein